MQCWPTGSGQIASRDLQSRCCVNTNKMGIRCLFGCPERGGTIQTCGACGIRLCWLCRGCLFMLAIRPPKVKLLHRPTAPSQAHFWPGIDRACSAGRVAAPQRPAVPPHTLVLDSRADVHVLWWREARARPLLDMPILRSTASVVLDTRGQGVVQLHALDTRGADRGDQPA